MFDSDVPRPMENTPSIDPVRFLVEFAHQCGVELTREMVDQLAPEERVGYLLEMTRRARGAGPHLEVETFRRLYLQRYRVFRANVRALRRYSPEVYQDRVVLLRAEDHSESAPPGPKWDWRDLAPHMEVQVVPGNHFSMIREPHVLQLACRLRNYLASATEA
jgi:thioesterase domain-containing protein